MKSLKTLEQYNEDRRQAIYELNADNARPMGIACPMCSKELVNPMPNTTFTTDLPKVMVPVPNVRVFRLCDCIGFSSDLKSWQLWRPEENPRI